MNVSENMTNSTNVISFFQGLTVGEHLIILSIILPVFLFFVKVWWDMKHKNYFDLKREHIGKLTKNILNRWRYVSCKLIGEFAVDRKFILLNGYQSISQHRDFEYAVKHIKKYPCWKVWEGVMGSFNNLNSSASKILNELNQAISDKIKTDLSISDIIIHQLPQILNEVVKILIEDSDKNRECDEYISIDTQAKWVEVQTDRVRILLERRDMQDLKAFKRIICGFITSEHYQKKIRDLLRQFENIKNDVKNFTDQLSYIATIAEHKHTLKGMCKACPRILGVFSP